MVVHQKKTMMKRTNKLHLAIINVRYHYIYNEVLSGSWVFDLHNDPTRQTGKHRYNPNFTNEKVRFSEKDLS